jgi:hypothetical protein
MNTPSANTKMLKSGDPNDPANFIDCVPFTGFEKDFPIGVILPPSIRDVTKLIKFVTILDAESDEGFKVIKKNEVTADMDILSVQLNENSIAMIVGPQGADSELIVLVHPVGGKQFTRLGWFENVKHTDGLAMWAATRLRRHLIGSGVQVGGV